MRKSLFAVVTSLSFCGALAIPAVLVAQDNAAQNHKPTHSRYKLVDMGTFGGPQSYLNDAAGLSSVKVVNNHGALTGWADTSTPDPLTPNFCFDQDCFVAHAFRWQNGVRSDLGILPGGSSSQANWISDSGLIAGVANNGEIDPLIGLSENRAVLWQNGRITDLGVLPEGGYESFANAVNGRGQVIGLALNTIPDSNSMSGLGFQTRAFFWEHGAMQDLGTLGSGTDAQALFINDPGQVVGLSYTGSTQSLPCASFGLPLATDSFLWDRENGMVNLGGFGGTCTIASGLNNRGQVVGESFLAGDQAARAFVWDRATGLKELATLGGDFASGYAINDRGEIVGASYLPGDAQIDAVLWEKTGTTDLGALDGDACSFAFSINTQRQIVGNSNCFFESTRGFLWENGGPMVDLNTLISSNSGLHVTVGLNINDGGEIAATAVLPNGEVHAVLLIPCGPNETEGCQGATAQEIGANSVDPGTLAMQFPHRSQRSSVKRFLGHSRLVTSPQKVALNDTASSADGGGSPQTVSLLSTTGATLKIISGAPPSGRVGKRYDFHCLQIPPCNVFVSGFPLAATGGVPPYSWTWTGAQTSSAPPGLNIYGLGCLNIRLPAICGMPTVAGTYNVIVTVKDSGSPATRISANYVIHIFPY